MKKHRLSKRLQQTLQRLGIAGIRNGLFLESLVAPRSAGKRAFYLFCTPRPVEPHPKETQILERGNRWTLQWRDGQVTGYTWEPAEYRQTVLLVHGWELHAGKMTAFVQPLVQAGYRVIAFHAPAHGGKNDRSQGKWLNAIIYARAIRAVMERHAQGSIRAVIAHSLGCMATTYLCSALYPENIQQPEKLIFIAPPTELAEYLEGFQSFLGLHPRVIRYLERYLHHQYGLRIEDFSMKNLAESLRQPVLLIHDKNDTVTSCSYSEEVSKRIQDCTFIQTENLGHVVILRSREVIQQIVDFLGESQSPELPTQQTSSFISAV